MSVVSLTKINCSTLLKQNRKSRPDIIAISIKVFFLFKFDDTNTNFCQFQYFFRKLTVKLQIKSIKEIRVLQGVRLPLLSLITRASQFVNINYYSSKLKSLQKNIDTHERFQGSIRFNTPMFKGCWGMLSDSEH